MTEPNITHKPKPASYWVITIVGCVLAAFLAGMAAWSLSDGDTKGFITFLLITVCVLIAVFPPKWAQRLSSWFRSSRGL